MHSRNSHVNFQMNAISSCVIILLSFAILANILLFMLSLHNSFMLFGCLFVLFSFYCRRFISVYVVCCCYYVSLLMLGWFVCLLDGWLVGSLLDFSTFYRQLMLGCQFCCSYIVNSIFLNIYQSPFIFLNVTKQNSKRKTKLLVVVVVFIKSVFVYFYISFCMSWRNVFFVVHFGSVKLMFCLDEFPKRFLYHLFVYQERWTSVWTFNGKILVCVCFCCSFFVSCCWRIFNSWI